MTKRQPGCYLLHFDEKLAHAGHYLGASQDVPWRLTQHGKADGSALMVAVKLAGIGWVLAREWRTTTAREAYLLEVSLKRRKNGKSLCPVCKGV